MNITKHQIDDLNALVNITIEKDDFQPKVDKVLADYKKKANIPGFRKGHVPLSLIKKQYEPSIKVDEINKLLQDTLNQYIFDEKLEILGNPLPKLNENFSWDDEQFTFDFELGLAPKFTIDWEAPTSVTLHQITVDDALLNEEITHLRKQYGKLMTESEVTENSRVVGVFQFTYKGESKENNATFDLTQLKDNAQKKSFIGKKTSDILTLSSKDLFKDDHDLMHALQLDHSDAHHFDAPLQFTINEINRYELAELNQEFLNKLFGEGRVNNEDEMKAEIKKSMEAQLNSQAENKFLNDATEYFIQNLKFDLPADFLKRWLQTTGEKELTEEQAQQEFERSEKGLRYHLIENQIVNEHQLSVTRDELKDHAKNLLKAQFAQYGSHLMEEHFFDDYAERLLQNKDEVKRVSEQIISSKLLNLFKEKMKYNTKTSTYKDFIEETYQ